MSLSSWARCVVCALVLALGAPFVQAQDPFSSEAVQAKITALEGATAESDVVALETYKQALASLQQAAEASKRAVQFQAETTEAPGFLETLRTELAAQPIEPTFPAEEGFTLSELESRLQQALAEQASARGLVEELDNLAAYRTVRNSEIPKELAASQQALSVAMDALEATSNTPDMDPRRTLLLAQIEEHRARVAALEAERINIEARREVLPLRRDRAARKLSTADKQVGHWKTAVDQKRAAEGNAAAAEAGEQLTQIMESFPALAELAASNHDLAAKRSGPKGLPVRIAQAQDEVVKTRELLNEVNRRFKAARRRIAAGGLTEGMGVILRRDYDWLSQAVESRPVLLQREERLSEAQLETIAIEEARFSSGSITEALEELVASLEIENPSPELVRAAQDLLLAQRNAQDAVLEDLMTLTAAYYDQGDLADQVDRVASDYLSFIEKRILWVRSSPLNPVVSARALPQHFNELFLGVPYATIWTELQMTAASNLIECVGLGLLLIGLLVGRKMLEERRHDLGSLVRSFRTDKYIYTFYALLITLVLAVPMPLVMWTLGWLLSESPVEFGRAISGGLRQMALIWLILRFLRGLLVERGLGPAHFRWPHSNLAAIRRELLWLEPTAVVLGLVVFILSRDGAADWSESIGRSAFVVVMIGLAFSTNRVMNAGREKTANKGKTLMVRAREVYALVATMLPIALALMALAGYYYTALQFEVRLRYSFGFAILLTMINAFLLRWLFMARRRLAVGQAMEERKRREEELAQGAEESSSPAALDVEKVDIPAVDAQTRQLFKSSLTMATVLGFYFIWAGVLPALKGLDRVQLLPEFGIVAQVEDYFDAPLPTTGAGNGAAGQANTGSAESSDVNASMPAGSPSAILTGSSSESDSASSDTVSSAWDLTLADVLLALVFGLLVGVAARNLPALLELALLQRLPLDSGSRYAISTIVRYLILILGVSLVSGTLGLSWQKVQWLAAALTFGLAFGLQEIFANFVSGIIILVERPIRVGDIVTVNGIEGRVSQLRMRATTIVDYNNRELLIPNKEFITNSVINWTLSDPVTRLIVVVGIAYGSDIAKARRVLLKVAQEAPDVLDEPTPNVVFIRFGDSTLDFELRVYCANRENWARVVNQVHVGIDNAFRKAGIEIAFPQRDLHVRSIQAVLPHQAVPAEELKE